MIEEMHRVIIGQDNVLEKLILALVADGHVLLEGMPGLAKTLMIKTLSDTIEASFKRIQFTPDLLPADIIGTRCGEMKKPSHKSIDVSNIETTHATFISESLFGDIRLLIESAKSHLAQTANSVLATLYWNVGKRIKADILGNERAQYGKEIVSALRRELSWTHFKEIIYIDDPLKRDFYAQMCRIERWSTRTLHAKIQGMLYERTALTKKSEKLITKELAALRDEDRMTPDLVFHDPYFLDFLSLSDSFSERDLESAILRELERFLLELGTDFTFVARQKRITIDNEDYYLDLLFYHRSMRRLVAIELKLGKFQAQDKGQMELYLRWLEKYEKRDGEESPLGLILCAERECDEHRAWNYISS
ncbi:MAG: PDDEXK nuclease domain-containing protein [Candidatus Methanoperedens sp.]